MTEFESLPNIGVVHPREDKFLGIIDQIPPKIGVTLTQLSKFKDYNLLRKSLKGDRGDIGEIGLQGPKGQQGNSAYTVEKSLLNVNTLSNYLAIIHPSYFTNLISKYTNPFISYWDTRNIDRNSSYNNQIQLPLIENGIYDCIVSWGDNTYSTIKNASATTHTYLKPGIYKIAIFGKIEGLSFKFNNDNLKILSIIKWGSLTFYNSEGAFTNCHNLKVYASDLPTFKGSLNLYEYFANCRALTNIPNLNLWPISSEEEFNSMFPGCINFNQTF